MRTNWTLLAVVCALGAGPAAAAAGEVAGYLGDTPITLEEVDSKAAGELQALRQQEFDLRSRALEQIVNEQLLEQEATRRGVSPEELLKAEVEGKVVAPPDAAVSGFYEANKPRMGGRSLEETSGQIRDYLLQQQRGELTGKLITSLRAGVNVRVLLDPPRVNVPIPAGEPTLGKADAKVTIVEFSDFQCPYCRRAHPTVERVLAEYGDRIRFVYRDYPLPNHPRALPASKAARCAGDQGKYWDFHDNLMNVNGDLSEGDLAQRGETLALDMDAFRACFASDRHEAAVKAGLTDGGAAGVNGTPAFFINGRLLSGAQPFEAFQQLLDDELARGASE